MKLSRFCPKNFDGKSRSSTDNKVCKSQEFLDSVISISGEITIIDEISRFSMKFLDSHNNGFFKTKM